MTDDELKELVASLAILQKETTAQIKAQQKETSAQQKETTAQQKETTAQIKTLRIAHEEINAQQKETSRKLDKVAKMIGGISHNQGDVAEDFFYNSFAKDNHLGDIFFDEIIKNMTMRKGKAEEEYDLLLINGDAIIIIEVKYKAHQRDIDQLERKTSNFKKFLPAYQHYSVYGAMASFHFNEDVKKLLLQEGYFVVERSGNLISTKSSDHLKVA